LCVLSVIVRLALHSGAVGFEVPVLRKAADTLTEVVFRMNCDESEHFIIAVCFAFVGAEGGDTASLARLGVGCGRTASPCVVVRHVVFHIHAAFEFVAVAEVVVAIVTVFTAAAAAAALALALALAVNALALAAGALAADALAADALAADALAADALALAAAADALALATAALAAGFFGLLALLALLLLFIALLALVLGFVLLFLLAMMLFMLARSKNVFDRVGAVLRSNFFDLVLLVLFLCPTRGGIGRQHHETEHNNESLHVSNATEVRENK